MPLYHTHLENAVLIPLGQDSVAVRRKMGQQFAKADHTRLTKETTFHYGKRRRFVASPSEDSDDWSVDEEIRRNWFARTYRRLRHLEDQEYKLVAAYDIPDDQERVYMGDVVTTEPSELYPRQDNFRNVEDILWFRSSTSHLVAPQPHILETLPMR